MGAEFSTNVAKQSVSVMNSVVTSVTNTCAATTSGTQIQSYSNNVNSYINADINYNQNLQIDLKCLQTANLNTQLQNQLTQAAQQTATAINQQFSLAQVGAATNITENMIKLSNAVQTAFTNKCSSYLQGTQALYANGNIGFTGIFGGTWNQTLTNVTNCVAQDSTVVGISNAISQSVAQTATAETENFFAGLIGLAIVGAAVAGIFTMMGKKDDKDKEAGKGGGAGGGAGAAAAALSKAV